MADENTAQLQLKVMNKIKIIEFKLINYTPNDKETSYILANLLERQYLLEEENKQLKSQVND